MSDAWACASSIRAAGRSIKGCFLVVCPVLRLCVKCHLICGRARSNHLRDSHPQACTRLHTASPRPAPRQAPAFHPDGARLKPSRPLWGPRVKVSPPDNRWPCSPHSAPSHWGLGTPDPHTRLLGLSRHLRDCVPLPPPCPPAPPCPQSLPCLVLTLCFRIWSTWVCNPFGDVIAVSLAHFMMFLLVSVAPLPCHTQEGLGR